MKKKKKKKKLESRNSCSIKPSKKKVFFVGFFLPIFFSTNYFRNVHVKKGDGLQGYFRHT